MNVEIIESKTQHPLCHPMEDKFIHGQDNQTRGVRSDGTTFSHSEFLKYLRHSRPGLPVVRDGWFSLSDINWANGDCSRGHPRVNKVCLNCGHRLTI